MKLLIARHAHAGDEAFKTKWKSSGRPDNERPLTGKGRRTMRKAAKGLRSLVPEIGLLAPSPLARAVQTADVLERIYGRVPRSVMKELSPGGSPQNLLKSLREPRETTIAIVGHEPDLSRFLGFVLTGKPVSFARLKKGQVCLVEFDGKPSAGGGTLAWSLTPKQLRALAR
ncbi:MAG: histidine phosphatase family protein [Elusimicrobia bacterium]|nr:histidine phosphatase family protein [Elusimicrobiota bacterium]